MAKWVHEDVIKEGFEVLKDSTTICLCSQQPTTRTEAITTYALGTKAVTGGSIFSWGDAVIGDGSRKLTMAAVSGVPVSVTGTYTDLAFVDGTRLLATVEAAPEKQVYDGDFVTVDSFGFIARQLVSGKFAHQAVLENGFQELIDNVAHICICSQEPSDRTEAYTTYNLGRKAISDSSFTWSTLGDDGGYKSTVDAIAGLQVLTTGSWNYTCFVDATRLLATTTNVTGEQVYAGAQINVDSKVFQFPQPTG